MDNDTETTPETRKFEAMQTLDRMYLKIIARGQRREAIGQVVIYTFLGTMFLYDPRLAAAFTLPLIGLSLLNEIIMHCFAADRFEVLYSKQMSIASMFIWPMLWHAWLVMLVLSVLCGGRA